MNRAQFLSLFAIPFLPKVDLPETKPAFNVELLKKRLTEIKNKDKWSGEYISFHQNAHQDGYGGILPVKKITPWMHDKSGVFEIEIHYMNENFKSPIVHQTCINRHRNEFYVVAVDNAEIGVCRLTLHSMSADGKSWIEKN